METVSLYRVNTWEARGQNGRTGKPVQEAAAKKASRRQQGWKWDQRGTGDVT